MSNAKQELIKIIPEPGFDQWLSKCASDIIVDCTYEELSEFAHGGPEETIAAWKEYKDEN